MPSRYSYSRTNPPVAMDASQWLTVVLGVAFGGAALAGFVMTGFRDFTAHDRHVLLGFEINPLHNLVHLTLALGALASFRDLRRTAMFGIAVALSYGATFVYGLVAVNQSWDPLTLNWADNGLHLVTAIAGVLVAVLAFRADRVPGPPSFS